MQSVLIQDNKIFMHHLLVGTLFDAFDMIKADLCTFCTISVDGNYLAGYLDRNEEGTGSPDPAMESFSSSGEVRSPGQPVWIRWEWIKPHMLHLIRGKSKPRSIRIVFRLSAENTGKVLLQSGSPLQEKDVSGLFLNISYQNQQGKEQISCVTGTSVRVFTTDRSLEHFWDELCCRFFRHAGIPFIVE